MPTNEMADFGRMIQIVNALRLPDADSNYCVLGRGGCSDLSLRPGSSAWARAAAAVPTSVPAAAAATWAPNTASATRSTTGVAADA